MRRLSELEKLERNNRWALQRQDIMGQRKRLKDRAEEAGEPVFLGEEPPIAAPHWFEQTDVPSEPEVVHLTAVQTLELFGATESLPTGTVRHAPAPRGPRAAVPEPGPTPEEFFRKAEQQTAASRLDRLSERISNFMNDNNDED